MKIKLYSDKQFEVNLTKAVSILNSLCNYAEFEYGNNSISFKSERIKNSSSYDELPNDVQKEANDYFLILIFTNKRYDNNYFFETDSNIYIISFSDWNRLTDINKSNGLIFFTASILCDEMHIGETHDESIGCINDFWFDKTKIDVGMRSAYLCNSCKKDFLEKTPNKLEEKVLSDITSVLDLVSDYSRKGRDILEFDPTSATKNKSNGFDVFLCHNSADKPLIQSIARNLEKLGLQIWLDEEQIQPGKLWQVVLEENIKSIKAAAIFVGQNNTGPWQDMEIRAFLTEFVNRSCPVIPVILENCTKIPELPLFLKQMMWVDMRKKEPDPIKQLKWGITGSR